MNRMPKPGTLVQHRFYMAARIGVVLGAPNLKYVHAPIVNVVWMAPWCEVAWHPLDVLRQKRVRRADR